VAGLGRSPAAGNWDNYNKNRFSNNFHSYLG